LTEPTGPGITQRPQHGDGGVTRILEETFGDTERLQPAVAVDFRFIVNPCQAHNAFVIGVDLNARLGHREAIHDSVWTSRSDFSFNLATNFSRHFSSNRQETKAYVRHHFRVSNVEKSANPSPLKTAVDQRRDDANDHRSASAP
jgi:hypothetical protein